MTLEAPANFATDTATLCIFDVAALKHRLSDDADWWTATSEEVAEVNAGNVAFFGLGGDGVYSLEVAARPPADASAIHIKVPSGRVFIGAGEEVTSAGLEPEGLRGSFIVLPPGDYVVAAKRHGNAITVSFALGGAGRNQFAEPVAI